MVINKISMLHNRKKILSIINKSNKNRIQINQIIKKEILIKIEKISEIIKYKNINKRILVFIKINRHLK